MSQAIDTIVVNFVLLAGTKPMAFISLTTSRNSYAVKLGIAIRPDTPHLRDSRDLPATVAPLGIGDVRSLT